MSTKEHSRFYVEYLKNKYSVGDSNKYFKEFEKLNTTTDSIYNLDDLNVLIILKDGTNLTHWNRVKNKDDVIYVSENLSSHDDLSRKYSSFKSLKAIVTANVTGKVTNMEGMFHSCESLKAIHGLDKWDVSGVKSMRAMFFGCKSLEDFSGLKNWDVDCVNKMEIMFNSCRSLSDISFLRNWNVSNVCDMNHMFFACWSLKDLSALKNWDVTGVKNSRWMFCGCRSLVDLKGLENWNLDSYDNDYGMFVGCWSLKDASAIDNWIVSNYARYGLLYDCPNLKKFPKWFNR